jgi:hypothetical protein
MELFLCEIRPGMKEVGRYKVPAGGATYVSLSSYPFCHPSIPPRPVPRSREGDQTAYASASGKGVPQSQLLEPSASSLSRRASNLPLHGRKGGLVRDSIADIESFRRPQHGVAGFDRNGWPMLCVGIRSLAHDRDPSGSKCSDGSYVLREIASRS